MAQLVVRNVDEAVKNALKQRALAKRRSMEAEARAILEAELISKRPGLGTALRDRFRGIGVELEKMPAAQLEPAQFDL